MAFGNGGLLGGAQKFPGVMERPKGVGGAIGQLFGGQNDPNLSQQQNEQAQKQAMMNAGLAMMLGSRGGLAQPGLMQILAQGALTGQQTGGQVRQQIGQKQQSEQIQQAIQNTPPDQLPALAQQLVAQGQPEAARVVLEIAKANKKDVPQRSLMEVKVGDEVHLVDRATGETVRTVSPSEQWLAAREQASRSAAAQEASEQEFDRSNALADDFRSATGEARTVAANYGTLKSAAEDPSAAGDLALVFSFMKMIDPGSTVREGEFANAQNAPGVPDRIRAQYNRVMSGERFTPDVREDFVSRGRRLAEQRRRNLQQDIDFYKNRAQRFNVDPDLVVYDYFAPVMGEGSDDPFGGL